MIAVDGRHIYINRGNTGAIRIKASGYDFTEEDESDPTVVADKCVFKLKAPDGTIVKEVIASIADGAFSVAFVRNDTINLAPGDGDLWSITYYIHPYYQDGQIVNGDIVYTPTKEPMPFTIWQAE